MGVGQFILHNVQYEAEKEESSGNEGWTAGSGGWGELNGSDVCIPPAMLCVAEWCAARIHILLFFLLFFLVTFLFFFFLSTLFCFPHFILIANYSFHQKIKIYFLFSLLLYFLFFFVPSPFRVSSTLQFLFFPAVDLSPESC